MRAATGPSADPSEPRITVEHPPVKRRFFRRRSNRRITVASLSIAAWVAGGLRAAATKLVVLGKVLVVAAFVAGALWTGRKIVQHVIASPRFAVHDVEVGPSTRVLADEIRELCGVRLGDRLLAVDPDAVAARLATHPWILSARVRRELPSTLAIEVTERKAVASALLGALYLLDEGGRPFKRATFAEADGLPVITGVTRDQYAAVRATSEAVFRQASGLYESYADGHPERPKLSEVHVDTRAGFTLVLYDGGGELRLGRGDFEAKLARLDRIFAALGSRGPAALETVYLDGPLSDRVTLRMAAAAHEDPAPVHPAPVLASEKPRPAKKRPEAPAEPTGTSDED